MHNPGKLIGKSRKPWATVMQSALNMVDLFAYCDGSTTDPTRSNWDRANARVKMVLLGSMQVDIVYH